MKILVNQDSQPTQTLKSKVPTLHLVLPYFAMFPEHPVQTRASTCAWGSGLIKMFCFLSICAWDQFCMISALNPFLKEKNQRVFMHTHKKPEHCLFSGCYHMARQRMNQTRSFPIPFIWYILWEITPVSMKHLFIIADPVCIWLCIGIQIISNILYHNSMDELVIIYTQKMHLYDLA